MLPLCTDWGSYAAERGILSGGMQQYPHPVSGFSEVSALSENVLLHVTTVQGMESP